MEKDLDLEQTLFATLGGSNFRVSILDSVLSNYHCQLEIAWIISINKKIKIFLKLLGQITLVSLKLGNITHDTPR